MKQTPPTGGVEAYRAPVRPSYRRHCQHRADIKTNARAASRSANQRATILPWSSVRSVVRKRSYCRLLKKGPLLRRFAIRVGSRRSRTGRCGALPGTLIIQPMATLAWTSGCRPAALDILCGLLTRGILTSWQATCLRSCASVMEGVGATRRWRAGCPGGLHRPLTVRR